MVSVSVYSGLMASRVVDSILEAVRQDSWEGEGGGPRSRVIPRQYALVISTDCAW